MPEGLRKFYDKPALAFDFDALYWDVDACAIASSALR